MLEKVKVLLGLTDNTKDNLLTILLEGCIEEAINYTHNEDIGKYDTAIVRMVVYQYNRLGTEGVDSENYSGVSFNYSEDYPESIMRQLRAFRKLRTL